MDNVEYGASLSDGLWDAVWVIVDAVGLSELARAFSGVLRYVGCSGHVPACFVVSVAFLVTGWAFFGFSVFPMWDSWVVVSDTSGSQSSISHAGSFTFGWTIGTSSRTLDSREVLP